MYALAENFPHELRYPNAVCKLEMVRGEHDGQWVLRARKGRPADVLRNHQLAFWLPRAPNRDAKQMPRCAPVCTQSGGCRPGCIGGLKPPQPSARERCQPPAVTFIAVAGPPLANKRWAARALHRTNARLCTMTRLNLAVPPTMSSTAKANEF